VSRTTDRTIHAPLEEELAARVEHIADLTGRGTGPAALSETATRLAHVGRGAAEAGDRPGVEGPFGGPRPFARVSFDGERTTTVETRLDPAAVAALRAAFDAAPETADAAVVRRAVALGALVVSSEAPGVEGPFGGPRPFARVDLPDGEVVGERARAALDEFRLFMRSRAVVWGPEGRRE
jgi:hypothetical protein